MNTPQSTLTIPRDGSMFWAWSTYEDRAVRIYYDVYHKTFFSDDDEEDARYGTYELACWWPQ